MTVTLLLNNSINTSDGGALRRALDLHVSDAVKIKQQNSYHTTIVL